MPEVVDNLEEEAAGTREEERHILGVGRRIVEEEGHRIAAEEEVGFPS